MHGSRPLVLAALMLWVGPAAALNLAPPRLTREQMELSLSERSRRLFVYGTLDAAAAPVLRERALAVARRLFGGDSASVRADREVDARAIGGALVFLIGGPRENEWTRRLAPAFPVQFDERQFRWFGRSYDRPGDVIHLVYPNPLDPKRFLLLVAGNSPGAMVRRGGGFFFGEDDWRIYREGELARSGRFAQSTTSPWRYDPTLDHDRERDRERFASGLRIVRSGGLELRAPPDLAVAAPVAAAAAALLDRLDRAGLAAPGTITLTLYRSLEEKGVLTRDTRPEHLEVGGAHAALPFGRGSLDLWSVAALRLRALGAAPDAPYLEPASTWLAGAFDGEPLERAVSRLYFGRLLPTAREAAVGGSTWRSPLVWVPARALLAGAAFECAGARGRGALRALLVARPPGALDSLCRAAGLDPARVERRYAALADSLARAGQRRPAGARPRPWRPADGFQRGVCLAHSVSMERGYLSASCAGELASLHRMGVDWVSLTPFGYLPSPHTPEIFPSAGAGADEESDESIVEAAAHARAIGMRVWLAPHLWTRGWTGDLEFGPAGWPRFFDQYRAFILHYALLAEREGVDGLFVGHELVSASLRDPDRWRALIADVRRVYGGTLTYGANWGPEFEGIAFWDALDLVSVSFYAPLSSAPTRSVPALRAGATKALATLRAVGARAHRPVLLAEIGYAPFAEAPVRPWEERSGAPDLETQRACYEAAFGALDGCEWVAGALVWKWFSSPDASGPLDPSFTPRGKPAEAVMDAAFKRWERRPVRVPAP
jgi:hypothetical protein